jgi:uncharacterized protein (DUF488 family)
VSNVTAAVQLWTIGHSNHTSEHLVELLQGAGIEVLVDVRSQPYSRFSGHFNQEALKVSLGEAGLRYLFLGRELGGRPPEPEMYDEDGHVLYGEVAKSERFRAGLERLIAGARQYRVAMMCSEENPADCHRRLLIARVLRDEGVGVTHIRGDGDLVSEVELSRDVDGPEQPTLFGEEERPWRSIRSVSRSTPPRSSSSH